MMVVAGVLWQRIAMTRLSGKDGKPQPSSTTITTHGYRQPAVTRLANGATERTT